MTMREAITKNWPEKAGVGPTREDFATQEGVKALVDGCAAREWVWLTMRRSR